MAATAVFVLSLVLSTYGFLLDNAPSSSQSDLFNSQYTGNGETPLYWRNRAKADLDNAIKNQPIIGKAKNTIIMLGDGMSMSTVTSSRILKGQLNGKTGEETILSWETFPHIALSKTYNQDYTTPDSAGTATAFLSGVKTNKGVIGVDASIPRGHCDPSPAHNLNTILDWSLAEGKSVGIVTTARITHATPASAYAHVASRSWEGDHYTQNVNGGCKDIALQLVEENPNIQVLMGGGRRFFLPYSTPDPESGSNTHYGRRDGRDLIKEWENDKTARNMSHKYVWNSKQFHQTNFSQLDYLLGLFDSSSMAYELDRFDTHYEVAGEPSLAEMTEAAITILQKNPKGFFLLVEGGKIDLAHHGNHAVKALHETLAFNDAVAKMDSMTNDRDTLAVVTADHSHTLVLAGYPARGNDILGLIKNSAGQLELAKDHKPLTSLIYGTGPGAWSGSRPDLTSVNTDDKNYVSESAIPFNPSTHAGEDVAIYAKGPMSHLFHATHEQSYIPHVLAFASCVGEYKNSCVDHMP
ncbi:alkaline phosphatase [Mytilus galloprovincialis]|uniref:Alkaline phosphatase, tissue-nonspecific isozyme n=1 Tax=Mytilus galloprovincialis TaxID=29158 RepID=A0A8B6GY89_MYTGA|nr:alkaline phosphatase [Mytilus galloprovincialis]